MKLISLSTDRKILEEGSPVRGRQVEYGKLFNELHIVLIVKDKSSEVQKISKNVFVHPVKIGSVFFVTKNLISDGAIVSAQDPFETGVIGVLLKLLCGVPLHIQLHTDFNNKYFLRSSPLNFIRFFIAHLVLPYADEVRVVSERVKRGIKELNKNIEVLPIRIELGTNNYAGFRKPFFILTVARLEKEKDLQMAIKAFAIASTNYPEAVFTIAGEGREKSNLQHLVKQLGIESKVKFIGWVKDLPKLYAENQIYISASLFEGYGMSMVEAALAGCALVISETGIAGEIPALVSKPQDIVAFSKNIEQLFRDQRQAAELGQKAASVAHSLILSREDYLSRYAGNIKLAAQNRQAKHFRGRVFDFIHVVFEANKVLRFIVAGSTAAGSQIVLLYIFTSIVGWWYLYSSILSFAVALLISFTLQKSWAFKDYGMEIVHIQFMKYAAVALCGLLFNTILMYFWVDLFGLWYLAAQIIADIIIAVYNFLMYRRFIFK